MTRFIAVVLVGLMAGCHVTYRHDYYVDDAAEFAAARAGGWSVRGLSNDGRQVWIDPSQVESVTPEGPQRIHLKTRASNSRLTGGIILVALGTALATAFAAGIGAYYSRYGDCTSGSCGLLGGEASYVADGIMIAVGAVLAGVGGGLIATERGERAEERYRPHNVTRPRLTPEATRPPPAEGEDEDSERPRPTGKGTLTLSASGRNLAIHVDGRDTGLKTPQIEIELTTGPHEITLLDQSGAVVDRFTVTVVDSERTVMSRDLRNLPAPATP